MSTLPVATSSRMVPQHTWLIFPWVCEADCKAVKTQKTTIHIFITVKTLNLAVRVGASLQSYLLYRIMIPSCTTDNTVGNAFKTLILNDVLTINIPQHDQDKDLI